MFTNITRTTLCITAFSIASLMAAPLDAHQNGEPGLELEICPFRKNAGWQHTAGTGKSHGIRHCHQ